MKSEEKVGGVFRKVLCEFGGLTPLFFVYETIKFTVLIRVPTEAAAVAVATAAKGNVFVTSL